MSDITIGDAAKHLGIRTSVLRYYESAGILPPAPRVNGRRRYTQELLDTVRIARFAQSVGFSLAEIRVLVGRPKGRGGISARWQPLARAKMKELDEVVTRARKMKAAIEAGLRCGCIRADDCRDLR